MITRLTVHGYKTLRDLTIPLSPVTVLVGANNVGKTNLVRAVELLGRSVRDGSIDNAIATEGGLAEIATLGGDGIISFRVEGELEGQPFTYELGTNNLERLDIKGPHGCSAARLANGGFADPYLAKTTYGGQPGYGLMRLGQSPATPAPVKRLVNFLSGMQTVDFAPARLREASLPTPEVVLGREGENLAAVLDRLQGERPTVRRRIDEEVRRAVPTVDHVTTIAQGGGMKIVGIAEGDRVFKADHVSDGILLFVGLSTVAQMSGGATLVAVEELERGIHPYRIRETLEQVRRVAETGSQFLLTTHSPVLLSEFRDFPEAVVILDRDAQAGTRAQVLSERPEIERALQNVSLGDLWYSGVLGGVPTE